MILAEWKCHRKGTAGSERAGHVDFSAMKPGQFPHERQPNSSTLKGPPSRALDAVEALENSRKLVDGDAGAGVGDRKLYAVSGHAEADYNATFEREFEGIGEKVQYDLLPHVAVYVHSFHNRLTLNGEGQSCLLHRRSEDAADLL